MRKLMIAPAALLLATGLALGGCTDSRTIRGAGIGAAGGAAVGAVVPGISTAEGAAVGAAAGAVIGATTKDNDRRSDEYCASRYPRDSRDYDDCRDGRL